MRKIAVVLPFPIVLALYACATGSDGGLDETPVISSKDAGNDAATTTRKDSGPASPPKDSGASSSSGDAGHDAGHSSSSGGSSGGSSSGSSSGNNGGVEACSQAEVIAAGISGVQPTQAASCDECPSGSCCVDGSIFAFCYEL